MNGKIKGSQCLFTNLIDKYKEFYMWTLCVISLWKYVYITEGLGSQWIILGKSTHGYHKGLHQ